MVDNDCDSLTDTVDPDAVVRQVMAVTPTPIAVPGTAP
jgi:hypothetical protein